MVWRHEGYRSAAEYLAVKGGSSVGEAKRKLETSRRLPKAPATQDKLRQGQLSGAQADAVADAAAANPGAEARLLDDSERQSLRELQDACAKAKAAADPDPDATWQRMFDANLNSAFHILRAVIPEMRKAGGGRIITIGSRAAEDPGPKVGAYSASKAALVSLMKTVARENNDAGITANVILPGTMDTPTNRKDMPGADISQWVQPASVASLIVWLAGDGGKDVTGAAIPVYGRGL